MFFYYDFYIPQDLLRQFVGRRTECVYHFRCVEVEDVLEILVLKMFGGIEPAARHQGVRYAVGQRVLKSDTEVKIVKFLKEAALGAETDFTGVVYIILTGKLPRNAVERIREGIAYIVVYFIKRIQYDFSVFLSHFPNVDGSGVILRFGVVHIENIFKARVTA